MSFWKKLFSGGEEKMTSYADFWRWFAQHEQEFYRIVKTGGDVAGNFLGKALPRLRDFREGYHLLAGMPDEETVELAFSANGDLKNMVFVDEIVAAAPDLPRWKFTILRPQMNMDDRGISIGEHAFTKDNIHFYAETEADYPDEVSIVLVHDELTEDNVEVVTHGTYLYLDHLLGEWNFATLLDNVEVQRREEATEELVPITKLFEYLTWREKEFVEKYEGVRKDTEKDAYQLLEAELEDGSPLIILVNQDLQAWEAKASHPWMLVVEMDYDGSANHGLPDEPTSALLQEVEDRLLAELKDTDGYLYLGRQTGRDSREVYFAAREFKQSSKIVDEIRGEYAAKIALEYDIYKDKYWRSFSKFLPQ